MHHVVREIVRGVAGVSESCEAGSVEVERHWAVACAQDVDPHVKLLPTDEQGVADVALGNIGLRLWVIWLPAQLIFPLRHLLQL
jgi:hypothetical protein